MKLENQVCSIKNSKLTKKQIKQAIDLLELEIKKREIDAFRKSEYGQRISLESRNIFIGCDAV